MTETTENLREAFERGGLDVSDLDGTRYFAGLDPHGAQQLCAALAMRVKPLGPTAIVVVDLPEDILLGHLVAKELGIRWLRYCEDAGEGHILGSIEASDRCLFVTDAIREDTPLPLIRVELAMHGVGLIGLATLAESAPGPPQNDRAAEPRVSLM